MNGASRNLFGPAGIRTLMLCSVLAVAIVGGGSAARGRKAPVEAEVTRPTTMSGKAGDASNHGAAQSVLLSAADLGPTWRTTEQLATERGVTIPQPSHDVPAASIDPGIEDPDTRCGAARLIGVPDGVKVDVASGSLLDENSGMVFTTAAVFPAESNASARFDAYVAAMRGCPDELQIGIQDANAPPGLQVTSDVEELDLPPGSFGLRTRTGIGGLDFGMSNVDVIVRRGRVMAGLSLAGFAGQRMVLDIAALSELMIQRLEDAEASLPPESAPVPLFSPHAASEEAAIAAITSATDYPAAWSAAPTALAPVEIEPSGEMVSIPLAGGSRMFLRSNSADCATSKLAPLPGMLARAGTGLMQVGRDHYVWHYAAVFEHEDGAREAAARVVESSKRCGEENAISRSPDITSEPTSLNVAAVEVTYLSAHVQRWHIGGHGGFPSQDDVTTAMFAVLRRGRIVATFEFNVTGEDPSAAQIALETAIAKLASAEALLR